MNKKQQKEADVLAQHDFALPRRDFLRMLAAGMSGATLLAACDNTIRGNTDKKSGASLPALTQWYHQYSDTGMQAAAQHYAKGYTSAQVTVQWQTGTTDTYTSMVSKALASAKAPDVFELRSPSIAALKAGLIAPLDDILSNAKSDFSARLLDAVTYNGKMYGIPMASDIGLLYYRKSLFQKAAVLPPTTMDQLIAAASALTSSSTKGLYLGQDGGIDALYQVSLWGAGAELIQDGAIVFDTGSVAQMYESMRQLTPSMLTTATTSWQDPTPFTQGLAAMQWSGLSSMPAIVKALGDDVDILPWPSLNASISPSTFVSGWSEMVYAKSKSIDAAKQYVKYLWLDTPSIETDWSTNYSFQAPARTSLIATVPQFQTRMAMQAMDYLNQFAHSVPTLWNTTMDTALRMAFSNVLKNNANAATEVHNAAQKCQNELSLALAK